MATDTKKSLVNEKAEPPKIEDMSEDQLRKSLKDARDEVTRANTIAQRALEDLKAANQRQETQRETLEHTQQENLKLSEQLESAHSKIHQNELLGRKQESQPIPGKYVADFAHPPLSTESVFLAMVVGTFAKNGAPTTDAQVVMTSKNLRGQAEVFAHHFNNK